MNEIDATNLTTEDTIFILITRAYINQESSGFRQHRLHRRSDECCYTLRLHIVV